jgi:SpoVK/Ycf46/Vps4 family AAA+-type ATPase
MKEESEMKRTLSIRLCLVVSLALLLASGSLALIRASRSAQEKQRAPSPTRQSALQEIVAAGRVNRAAPLATRTGVRVLFTGPCATEKSVAAAYLARELGVDLVRVDLGAIASKYIGETEKNLERLFATAESRHAVLFFDEADALFGKRSEVKDAHDRYANLHSGDLLQRIERYQGIAIMTSSPKDNVDKAFRRRVRFVMKFCE